MPTPQTAVLLCCQTCGLVRVADDAPAAQARGQAHQRFSGGHHQVAYCPIEAPERLRLARAFERRSRQKVDATAGAVASFAC